MFRLLNQLLIMLVRLYRCTLSPVLAFLLPAAGCRFEPTCSVYALQALERHGPIRGAWLALKRLARCHPWGGCGHDPVPPLPAPHHQGVEGCRAHSPLRAHACR
jgi:hypothetical protein